MEDSVELVPVIPQKCVSECNVDELIVHLPLLAILQECVAEGRSRATQFVQQERVLERVADPMVFLPEKKEVVQFISQSALSV